jgi:hypothetical protein
LGGWGRASARPQLFATGGSLRSSPASPVPRFDNALVCCLALADAEDRPGAIELTNPQPYRWECGVRVVASGPTSGIVATLPVPKSWPEQDVTLVSEDLSSHVRSARRRVLDGGVEQLTVTIPRLDGGDTATALLTLDIIKRDIVAPTATDALRPPATPSRQLRVFLQPSPYIESDDPAIRAAAEQVVAGLPPGWAQAEAIYDWVRQRVEYRFDERIKSARQALEDGFGDCEELTSLFVAMCRATGIPARSVWVPGHCYPEFYLEDEQGEGHWYPCQAAGTRLFGAMQEARPILQKGDSFRVAGQRQPVRYVHETLSAKNAASDPTVQFVQQRLAPPPAPEAPTRRDTP